MDLIIHSLEEQGVSAALLRDIAAFREQYPVSESLEGRITPPPIPYYGKETFEMAACALLQGEHILLTGAKAAGKNILAENLAYLFHRPSYNISFHVNMDSSTLIGSDTFRNNQVGRSIFVRKMAALAFLMRSIWQRTMQYPCCMRRLIIAGSSMCRAMNGFICMRRRDLSGQ